MDGSFGEDEDTVTGLVAKVRSLDNNKNTDASSWRETYAL